jgi:hypothetical protein
MNGLDPVSDVWLAGEPQAPHRIRWIYRRRTRGSQLLRSDSRHWAIEPGSKALAVNGPGPRGPTDAHGSRPTARPRLPVAPLSAGDSTPPTTQFLPLRPPRSAPCAEEGAESFSIPIARPPQRSVRLFGLVRFVDLVSRANSWRLAGERSSFVWATVVFNLGL